MGGFSGPRKHGSGRPQSSSTLDANATWALATTCSARYGTVACASVLQPAILVAGYRSIYAGRLDAAVHWNATYAAKLEYVIRHGIFHTPFGRLLWIRTAAARSTRFTTASPPPRAAVRRGCEHAAATQLLWLHPKAKPRHAAIPHAPYATARPTAVHADGVLTTSRLLPPHRWIRTAVRLGGAIRLGSSAAK